MEGIKSLYFDVFFHYFRDTLQEENGKKSRRRSVRASSLWLDKHCHNSVTI